MPKLSIAIPCYEMGGKGAEFLQFSLKKIVSQTFQDFEVIVADHSVDNAIIDVCDKWLSILDIKYFRNENNRGNAAANTNFSIEKSSGEYIKLLCQDDYLYNYCSLELLVKKLEQSSWQATAYVHSDDRNIFYKYHSPTMNSRLYVANTLGTPSCITIKNLPDLPKIDEKLSYAYDCDFYYRLFLQYGNPTLFEYPTIVNYLWGGSITSRTSTAVIEREFAYILNKYGVV